MLEFAPAMSPSGNTRPREHDACPNPWFLAQGLSSLVGRKARKSVLTAPEKITKTVGANPSVASLDICGPAMSPSGNTSLRLFGPVVSPCGSTSARAQDASPNPGFLASGLPHSLGETRKKPPSLHPKKSKNGRYQPVGSLVGHLGLQCLPLRTPFLGS